MEKVPQGSGGPGETDGTGELIYPAINLTKRLLRGDSNKPRDLPSTRFISFVHPVPAFLFMNSQLLEEALKHVPTQQALVNIVSKRVRQLNQGSRPLVDAPLRAGFADVALQEIVEGKLAITYPESAQTPDA